MTTRRSANDHLKNGKEPKIIHMIPPRAPGFREADGGSMVVSTPAEVNALIRVIKPGEIITLNDLRKALARRHGTTVACPVSTAIFVNMAARAAEENRALEMPDSELTPYWRVLKNGGFLNPKYPGGTQQQADLLVDDGVKSSLLRKQLAVFDYEARRPADLIEDR
jgi:alkylated DNA nucleotide flippase Atl1